MNAKRGVSSRQNPSVRPDIPVEEFLKDLGLDRLEIPLGV